MLIPRALKEGFTLLEMLLVLAVASAVFVMLINYSTQRTEQMRIDKATLQIQQILNAAMAFYVNNSRWPYMSTGSTASVGVIDGNHELVVRGYLPAPSSNASVQFQNPWGRGIYVGWANSSTTPAYKSQYYVASITGLSGTSYPGGVSPNARIVAGRLPLGFVTDWPNWNKINTSQVPPTPNTSSCAANDYCAFAVGSVNIPGQNLNNARSVNFASIYSSGACVPEPTCPAGMIPQILVVPVSVSGVNDSPGAPNVYPLTSFTANAYPTTGPAQPPLRGCVSTTAVPCFSTDSSTTITTGNYWRVCLNVVTQKGTVTPTTQTWGVALGSILAITRCTPGSGTTSTEPVGTSFGVWQQ